MTGGPVRFRSATVCTGGEGCVPFRKSGVMVVRCMQLDKSFPLRSTPLHSTPVVAVLMAFSACLRCCLGWVLMSFCLPRWGLRFCNAGRWHYNDWLGGERRED